jgi:hypothetical protein
MTSTPARSGMPQHFGIRITDANKDTAALCCTDQRPGAVGPRSDILREANVLRPPKLEHAVQRGDSNGHLGRLPPFGP